MADFFDRVQPSFIAGVVRRTYLTGRGVRICCGHTACEQKLSPGVPFQLEGRLVPGAATFLSPADRAAIQQQVQSSAVRQSASTLKASERLPLYPV